MKRSNSLFVFGIIHATNVASFHVTPQVCLPGSCTSRSKSNFLVLLGKNDDTDQEPIVVEKGREGDVFTQEQWDDIQEGQPSQMSVMKELLGINIFTYILAFLIVAFGGLNLVLGPGWLGGTLGIQGTGSIEEVSPSLPNTMDLNKDEYLL